MKLGGKMIELILICAVALLAYINWRASKEDEREIAGLYNRLSAFTFDVRSANDRLDEITRSLNLLSNDSVKSNNKMSDLSAEIDKVQDHLARLRQNHLWLKNKLGETSRTIRIQGPVVVDVKKDIELKPDPKLMRKVKKQIERLK